jgi:hypothetical protein
MGSPPCPGRRSLSPEVTALPPKPLKDLQTPATTYKALPPLSSNLHLVAMTTGAEQALATMAPCPQPFLPAPFKEAIIIPQPWPWTLRPVNI